VKASGITISRKHVTVIRTQNSAPITLICPFCSRQGDSSPYGYEQMGIFSGTCGTWCPHFGTPVKNPDTGLYEIELTCGTNARLETASLLEKQND